MARVYAGLNLFVTLQDFGGDPKWLIGVVRIMVMIDPEQCRAAAEKCEREAERAPSPIERERWLKMAAEWNDLARQAQRRSS